jgi:hypothetical protein
VSLAGSFSSSTIANYLYRLHAWHLLHSIEWRLNGPKMEALLKGAARLAPAFSKQKQCQPYNQAFIEKVQGHLNLESPLNASVFDSLYSMVCLGEFMVPRLSAFSPTEHIIPANLHTETNQASMEVTMLHIPCTKAAPLEDEDIFWSCQHGPTVKEYEVGRTTVCTRL